MPSTSRLELPAWRRAAGDKPQHFWRRTPEGEVVSLCRLTLESASLRAARKAPACPVCREGLRRAHLVREFCRGHIRLDGEAGGAPFEFEEWYWHYIVLPIYGTLEPDGEGGYRRAYSKAIIGLPRWHSKSTGVAALALCHMALEPIMGSESFAVATTKKQAGVVLSKARRMVKADALLNRAFSTGRTMIECAETEATFTAIPHDADTAQGFHPVFAGIDEVHVHKSPAMIEAMVSGAAGFREPLVLLITTAGAERRGVWWDLLIDWAKDPGAYIYWCGASDDDDPTDPAVWRKANPASWISDDMLRRQFLGMPLASFMRYHLNLAPKRRQNRVFRADLWRACDALPQIDPERPCVIAVDASLRRDHTAVVIDQLGADGVHNALAFTFTAEEDDSIMGAIDHDLVGNLLRELCASYEVRRVPCDRAYFVRTMRELLEEGLPIEIFEQTNQNMARACQRLYDVVTETRLRHGGDAVLEEHVLNAAVKETPFGWRMNKASEDEKIDAAIALAMAVDVAEAEAERGGIGIAVG